MFTTTIRLISLITVSVTALTGIAGAQERPPQRESEIPILESSEVGSSDDPVPVPMSPEQVGAGVSARELYRQVGDAAGITVVFPL